jgi:hypothetical protein
MLAVSRSTAFLALGPALGVLLIALVVAGNSGPGAFVFSLVVAAGLAVVAPVLQLVLRRVGRLKNRPGLRFAIAAGAVVLAMFAVASAALFNQW